MRWDGGRAGRLHVLPESEPQRVLKAGNAAERLNTRESKIRIPIAGEIQMTWTIEPGFVSEWWNWW